jgi:hypothetical protein
MLQFVNCSDRRVYGCLATRSRAKRSGRDEAEVDLVEEGLLRDGDLGDDEPRPRLEKGCVVAENGGDDSVFVRGRVHARSYELRGSSGIKQNIKRDFPTIWSARRRICSSRPLKPG